MRIYSTFSIDKIENALIWTLHWYSRLVKFLAIIAGIVILILVGISIRETIMRNFGYPSFWASELTEILVFWVFLLPMAFTQIDGGMVRVTFIVEKLPVKVYAWMKVVASLSAVIFGILLFKSGYLFLLMVVPGAASPEIGWPAAAQRAAVPICSGLLVISGLLCAMRDVVGIIRGTVTYDLE